MSREIKFRVWVTNLNEFVYGITVYPSGATSFYHSETGYNVDIESKFVQQYTGLKDSTGKEIYEGDIIQYNYKEALYDDGATFIVDPIEPLYGTTLTPVSSREKSRKYDFKLSNYMTAGKIYVSVVGNTFENPELLKLYE